MNNETIRTCSDERPCINCYADQGECLGPAPETVRQRDAATLKAAQGGVTEAGYVFVCSNPACRAVHIRDPRGFCPACVAENGSGWSTTRQRLYRDGPERYSTEEEGEAFMDGWYDGQAALSVQQGQGQRMPVYPNNAKLALQFGYVRGFLAATKWPAPVSQDVDSPAFQQECGEFVEQNVALYTTPPAQPAERVPEAVLGYCSRDDAEKLLKRKGEERINFSHIEVWNQQSEFYPVAIASPAPSPARGDGGEE